MNNHIKKELIIKYLKDNNLTKKSFCKFCKISVNTLNKILQNKNVNLINIFKIAKGMNVHISYILDNIPIKKEDFM